MGVGGVSARARSRVGGLVGVDVHGIMLNWSDSNLVCNKVKSTIIQCLVTS